MFNYLTRTNGSPFAYLAKAWATVMVGTVVFILVASLFLESPAAREDDASNAGTALFLLVIWPVFATGLVHGALTAARRISPTYWHAAAGTALMIALIFGMLGGPIVGIVYGWPFFIYCVTFLAWQLKSTLHAWGMTVVLQALVNLLPVLLLEA